jgi:hypothetical protein
MSNTASALALSALLAACAPTRPVAYPISESHAPLTASQYEEAEVAFSGGPMPIPAELAAVDCQRLLDRRDTASAFALGLTSLGGGTGLATLIPKDATPQEQRDWNLGLGITTLAAATTATVLGALVRSWSARFEAECSTRPASADADGNVE